MSDQPNESVELDIDDEKVQAWDEVKDAYLVNPEEGLGESPSGAAEAAGDDSAVGDHEEPAPAE
jgi:hypothetical protein